MSSENFKADPNTLPNPETLPDETAFVNIEGEDSWREVQKIGGGATATVYKMNNAGNEVALKVYKLETQSNAQAQQQELIDFEDLMLSRITSKLTEFEQRLKDNNPALSEEEMELYQILKHYFVKSERLSNRSRFKAKVAVKNGDSWVFQECEVLSMTLLSDLVNWSEFEPSNTFKLEEAIRLLGKLVGAQQNLLKTIGTDLSQGNVALKGREGRVIQSRRMFMYLLDYGFGITYDNLLDPKELIHSPKNNIGFTPLHAHPLFMLAGEDLGRLTSIGDFEYLARFQFYPVLTLYFHKLFGYLHFVHFNEIGIMDFEPEEAPLQTGNYETPPEYVTKARNRLIAIAINVENGNILSAEAFLNVLPDILENGLLRGKGIINVIRTFATFKQIMDVVPDPDNFKTFFEKINLFIRTHDNLNAFNLDDETIYFMCLSLFVPIYPLATASNLVQIEDPGEDIKAAEMQVNIKNFPISSTEHLNIFLDEISRLINLEEDELKRQLAERANQLGFPAFDQLTKPPEKPPISEIELPATNIDLTDDLSQFEDINIPEGIVLDEDLNDMISAYNALKSQDNNHITVEPSTVSLLTKLRQNIYAFINKTDATDYSFSENELALYYKALNESKGS